MSDSDIFIAIGSNIDPHENIERALTKLNSQLVIISISNFYRTAAFGRPEQPDFLNGVIRIQTDIGPRNLKFEILRKIEDHLGRLRSTDKFASRTIDLDVIFYGSSVINEPDLHLPDPALRAYPFVAIPLLELAPDLVMPDTHTRLADEPIVKEAGGLHFEPEFTIRLRRIVLGC
jgi:2-amino-4-hydroxy-6-hydroxymethyldihydropteridine diphosphokinase